MKLVTAQMKKTLAKYPLYSVLPPTVNPFQQKVQKNPAAGVPAGGAEHIGVLPHFISHNPSDWAEPGSSLGKI